jgi:hypothetical protein
MDTWSQTVQQAKSRTVRIPWKKHLIERLVVKATDLEVETTEAYYSKKKKKFR